MTAFFLPSLRGSEASEAIHLESINQRNAKSFTKSLESQKDSSDSVEIQRLLKKIDCHENPCRFSRNDEIGVDCHSIFSKCYGNDGNNIDSHAKPTACLAMTILG